MSKCVNLDYFWKLSSLLGEFQYTAIDISNQFSPVLHDVPSPTPLGMQPSIFGACPKPG